MKSKTRAASVALVTGTMLAGVAAAPAFATTASSGSLTISVPSTTVYKSGSCANYAYTIDVDVPDGSYWSVDVDISRSGAVGDFDFAYGQGPDTVTEYAYLCPWLDGFGTFRYEAHLSYDVAEDHDGDGYADDYYSVEDVATAKSTFKSPAKATVDASPEPVRKGKAIHVKGKVTARNADWVSKPVKNQYVSIQRKVKGSSTWTYVGKDKTDSAGRYSLATTASRDASYRAVFQGTGTVAGVTTGGDAVDVR
jgi:hypothetical protein